MQMPPHSPEGKAPNWHTLAFSEISKALHRRDFLVIFGKTHTIMAILIEAQASEAKVLSDYERDKPMPSTNHAFLQDNISFELNLLYRAAYKVLPEISLATPGRDTVPDLAIYPKFALDLRHDVTRLTDPPLVTIEILSPEQNLQDLIDKTDRYFEFGVKSCWIVLPSLKTIIVYSGVDTFEYVKGGALLKDPNTGFELNLSKVFE